MSSYIAEIMKIYSGTLSSVFGRPEETLKITFSKFFHAFVLTGSSTFKVPSHSIFSDVFYK